MTGTVYVVGAGLAGLSAAASIAAKGIRVEVFEAAPRAGGRCRSYFDPVLNQVIDNGNHLVLSGNWATNEYLKLVKSRDGLVGPEQPEFAFVDLATDERWKVAPNAGGIPYWIFDVSRRVPGTRAADYAKILRLLWPPRGSRIGEVISCRGNLWQRLLKPLLVAALNSEPETASAELAGAVLRETLAKGGWAYRPRLAWPTLGAAFIDPALAFLGERQAAVHFGQRLRGIAFKNNKVSALELTQRRLDVSPADIVVLAVPPWAMKELIAEIVVPTEFRAILNLHFQIALPPGGEPMTGVLGGTAEWIFTFPDRVAVTVSNADALMDEPRNALTERIWAEVSAVLRLNQPPPPFQIVKERRATFAATPDQVRLRPDAKTHWHNLLLAGDWTNTGLPATIESAIRSGRTAARLALKRLAN